MTLTRSQARLRKMVLDAVQSPHTPAQLRQGARPVHLLCQPTSLPVIINGVAGVPRYGSNHFTDNS
jgi:hypothetical protein